MDKINEERNKLRKDIDDLKKEKVEKKEQFYLKLIEYEK